MAAIKRIIMAILVSALIMVMFTSCSGDADDASSDDTSTSEAAQEATEDFAEETEGYGELITINFPSIWVGTDSKAEVFGKMVDDFNQENEGQIVVEVEEITDYDLYEDKIRTMISTGDAPDVFTVKAKTDVELFAESGKIMDLSQHLTNDPEWTEVFLEGFLDSAQFEGKNFAIPYETQLIPIMYNNALLEEAGVEELPTTWDEFWDMCASLEAAGVFPTTQMTMNNAWTSMLFFTYALASTGGPDVYDLELDDPAYVAAAEIMREMFNYTSTDAIGSDATVVNGHFFNERAAVYTNGTWILGRIQDEGVEGLYDNIAISGSMAHEDGESGAYINGVQAYFVAGVQDDPAKEEAIVKFLKHICNSDSLTELSDSSGATFAVAREVDDSTDPLLAEIIEQSQAAPFSIGSFESMMPTAVAAEFPTALESLVLDEYTPEEFVQVLKDAAEY